MRANTSPHVQVKAAGGVRTLDALLEVMALGRDPGRRDGDRRRSSTTSGPARPGATARGAGGGRRPRPRAATDGRRRSASGCSAPGSSASSTRSACATCRTPASSPTGAPGRERREAFAARFGSRPLDSIEARLRRPGGRPRRRLPAEPPPPRGRPRPPRPTARASPARSRSGGTPTRRPRCSASSREAGRLQRLPRERRLQRRDDPDARDDRGRRDRPARPRSGPARATAARTRPHFWDAELAGGGALLDMASHGAEAARSCSARTSPFATCSPGATRSSTATGRPVEDNAVMLIRFEDGRVATMDVSWSSKGGLESRFEAYGDARPDRPGHHLEPAPGVHRAPAGYLGEKVDADTGWVYPVPNETYAHGHDAMMADVVDAFRDGPPPQETFEDGLIVNAILDAAYRSIRSGRWEPVERPWRSGCGDRVTQAPDDDADRQACAALDDGGRRAPRRGRRDPGRGASRPPASGRPRRSPPTASSTSSGPATRGSRSRRCSRATARTRASTRSSSCR